MVIFFIPQSKSVPEIFFHLFTRGFYKQKFVRYSRKIIVLFVTLFIRQNLNENLGTLHLALTLFYHLPGMYFKTRFLNPYPLSLDCMLSNEFQISLNIEEIEIHII